MFSDLEVLCSSYCFIGVVERQSLLADSRFQLLCQVKRAKNLGKCSSRGETGLLNLCKGMLLHIRWAETVVPGSEAARLVDATCSAAQVVEKIVDFRAKDNIFDLTRIAPELEKLGLLVFFYRCAFIFFHL